MLYGRGWETAELLPYPEERLRVSDVLVVVGTAEDIDHFRRGATGPVGAGRLT